MPQPKPSKNGGQEGRPGPEPLRAKVEAEVLQGNAAAAKATAKNGPRDDRPWALAAGGMAALDSNAAEAAEMLTEAAGLLEGEQATRRPTGSRSASAGVSANSASSTRPTNWPTR